MGRPRNTRRRRFRPAELAGEIMAAVRSVPHLTLLASAVGVLVSALVAWKMMAVWTSPDAVFRQVELAHTPQNVREFTHEFMEQWLWLSFLLFAPALVLGLVRSTGMDRLLPLGLATVAGWLFWLQSDLYAHFTVTQVSPLGEEPSEGAYWVKVIFVSLAILSPTAMYWAYIRGSILDRYVVRTFAAPFSLCFLGLLALCVVFDFFNNGKDFIDARFGIGQIALFYLVQIPKFTVEILDISLLLGVLYALSRMSRYNEVISMVTAGRSIPRIILPLLLVGFFSSVIALAFNFQWAPEAERKKTDMLRAADDVNRRGRDRTGNADRVAYMNRNDNRFWYCHMIPIDLSKRNKIDQIEIHEHDKNGRLRRSIYAKSGYWFGGREPTWVLDTVRIFDHGKRPGQVEVTDARQQIERNWSETPWRLLSESEKLPAPFLSVPQLASYLNTNREFPEVRLAPYRTWWHDRLARPLRGIIVVLFAAPLGMVFSRRGLMGSVGSTMLLYFGMYFLAAIFVRLGETSKLPAGAASWSVNVLFAVIGVVLLWQRATNTDARALTRRLAFWKKA